MTDLDQLARQCGATQPADEAVPKCAQCKKEYKPGKTSVGCPKCAPGVRVSEAEFQKPIRSRQKAESAMCRRCPGAAVFISARKQSMSRCPLCGGEGHSPRNCPWRNYR
jgi:Zn finger protein HypA/HybF involved in hydrogenase expression